VGLDDFAGLGGIQRHDKLLVDERTDAKPRKTAALKPIYRA